MLTLVKVLVQQHYYSQGFDTTGKKRDSDGGYVQATYVIPTGTKLGVSYGISKLDDNAADTGTRSC